MKQLDSHHTIYKIKTLLTQQETGIHLAKKLTSLINRRDIVPAGTAVNNLERRHKMRHATLSIILAFHIGLFAIGQVFAVPQEYRQPVSGVQKADDTLKNRQNRIVKAETARIMPVLADRIEDPAVLAKTRDKLLTLPVEEIQLVSSLCDRVSASERTARADIAFSLVTALIVLS